MIHHIFGTHLHYFDIDSFEEDKILKYCYQERKKDPKGVVKSNEGGWQSDSKGHNDSFVYSFIKQEVVNYYWNERCLREGVGLSLINMWININQKGDWNQGHHHPRCDLSGVLWIKTPENSGKLSFENPNSFALDNLLCCTTEEFKQQWGFYCTYKMTLKPGRIVLFPSHLVHRVEPSQSRQDRISISFNINLEPPKDM